LITLSHFHLELLLRKNQNIPIAGKVASKRHAWNIKRWDSGINLDDEKDW
jgi:hypothetical protein